MVEIRFAAKPKCCLLFPYARTPRRLHHIPICEPFRANAYPLSIRHENRDRHFCQ